jgi:2-dehydro-3-deoxygluconokinase
MKRVITFGEAIVRLSPPGHGRIEQARSLDLFVGGAELSAAAGLVRLGVGCALVTALPDTPIGRLVLSDISGAGIDVKHIIRQPSGRVGIYFAERGASPRPPRVLYDRDGSAISRLRGTEIDWKRVLTEYDHFHTTGVTLALGSGCLDLARGALTTAKKLGLSTSFDLSYRPHLWGEVRAQETVSLLLDSIDHLIATEEDILRVFKIRAENHEALVRELIGRFNLESCALTLRDDQSPMKNRWSAIAANGRSFFTDRSYDVEVVDSLGAGDAFDAGYIYGIITGDIGMGLKVGNAMASLKHSVPGDMIVGEKEEILALARGLDAPLGARR